MMIQQVLPYNVYLGLINSTAASALNPYATISDLTTGYVPYVGATADVNLGAFSIITPTVYGSNAASGNLTIRSTSDSTGGTIFFGANSIDQKHVFHVGTSTGAIQLRSLVGTLSQTAIYLGVAAGSETSSNYTLNWSGALNINAQADTSSMIFSLGTQLRFQITGNASSGQAPRFLLQGSLRSNITANTESHDLVFNSRTQSWQAGTVALQRGIYFAAQTYNNTNFTNLYNLYVESNIVTGGTATNNYAAGFNGNVNIIGDPYINGVAPTGSGSIVLATSPTFGTDITTPLIIGGTGVGSTIQYKGTSGNGTSTVAAHQFLVGNNGGTTAFSIFNNGTANFGGITQNTSGFGILRVQQGTSSIDLGDYASNAPAIWINKTPNSTNYSFTASLTSTLINCELTGSIAFNVNTTERMALRFSGITTNFANAGTGTQTVYNLSLPAITGQTAGTNIPSFRVSGNTKTWAAGTLSTQYFNYFTANTVAFASPSIATNVYNLFVEAPIQGTNATITNNYAAGFGGNVYISSSLGIQINASSSYGASIANSINIASGNLTFAGGDSRIIGVRTGLIYGLQFLGYNGSSVYTSFKIQTSNTSGNLSGGITSDYLWLPQAWTNQTASTERNSWKYISGSTQWATGAITIQREIYFTSPTYSFVGPSTITNAYGAYFEAATAGANAVITRNFSIGTDSAIEVAGQVIGNSLSSSAATLALTNNYARFIFTGSSATTWTMFSLASNTNKNIIIHNRGTASITLNSNLGANDFFDLGVITNIKIILPGETYHFYNDGTYFIIY